MPFNVPIIVFAPATRIRAEDVNANFTSLNTITAFDGGVPTMNFDGGKLTSDGSGNIQLQGLTLNHLTKGDMLSWANSTNTQVSAPSAITFLIGIQAIATINAGGVQLLPTATTINGPVGGGIVLGQGSITRISSFSGAATGVYNHNNQGIPTMCFPMQMTADKPPMATGYDTLTATAVHVSTAYVRTFTCLCIGV